MIVHEAVHATTFPQQCLRDLRSGMGTFVPGGQLVHRTHLPAAVPALQAQREPFAGPDDQQIIAIQIP